MKTNETVTKTDKKNTLLKPKQHWPEPSTPDDMPFANLKIPLGYAKAN